jgi:hypothetical protein
MNDQTHPYQGAYDLEWTRNYNGLLTDDEIAMRKREWVNWVDANLPLTMDIYDALEPEDKRRYRIGAWVWQGGLHLVSARKSVRAFRRIENKYEDIAAERAMEMRRKAGWRGHKYLTDPDGEDGSGVGNRQRWGRFTIPGLADINAWDGVLRGRMRFVE